MRPLVRPRQLSAGDRVRVISPSGPAAQAVPRRLGRAVAHLEAMGYEVELGAHVRDRAGHSAGSVDARLADLHAAFADEQVAMVLASIGGYSSHQLLEDLDFDLIGSHPKIFMGYSDITALLVPIYAKTGLVTFLGPAALPQFGEAGGLLPYTRRMWEQVVSSPEPVGTLTPAYEVVAERLAWDREDIRPRRLVPHPGPRALQPGIAEGPLVAANLGTLLLLAGTPYWPDLRGCILCVEEDEEETPATLDRMFTHLRHMGVLHEIAGLAVGRMPPDIPFTPDDSLEEIVARAVRGDDLPVALDLDFGHWDPILTLPLGVRARLTVGDTVELRLLEAAVEARA